MTQKERMEAGSLYDPADEAILKEQKGRLIVTSVSLYPHITSKSIWKSAWTAS